ncbi:MAG: hypothetical protein KGZ84_00890 [Erysipelotrichia bacterium]|jgi:hypothetical protein|nr:hypothetical protein [Erysipelotrichia bacterium]
MKIFVIKHTFFSNSYRCSTVRERCLKYANEMNPSLIVITGMNSNLPDTYHNFVSRLNDRSTIILREKQIAEVDDVYIQIEDESCLIHNKVIKTQRGMMSIVEVENNKVHVKTLVLDIFSDEEFADYHGDLSDQDLKVLTQMIKK